MGAECVRASPRPSRAYSTQLTESKFSPQKSRMNSPFEFQLKVENLCLTSKQDNVYDVVFEIEDKMSVHFQHEDMTMEGKLFAWKNPHRQKIAINFEQICMHPLIIKVFSKHREKLEHMSLKLDQLFRGAIHHDHMLPRMKSRLIFDIEVNQSIEAKICCQKLKLTNIRGDNNPNRKFCYSLFLILNNFKSKLQESTLCELDEMASVGGVVLNNQLQQSSLRLVIYEKENMLEEQKLVVFSEVYIPYQKIVSQCTHFKKENRGNIEFQKRSVMWEEELDLLGHKKGTANFEILLETEEVYVEQLEGLISSEKGISSISPQFLKGLGGNNSSIFNNSNINLNFNKLKDLVKKFKKPKIGKPIGGTQSRSLLLQAYQSLTTAIQNPKGLDDEQFDDEEPELEEMQEILLDLLIEVGKLIVEGQEVINENVWRVFQTIFRRTELSIRCINCIENNSAQKKKIGIKFYTFLCSTLEKIVRSTAMWITYRELKYTQKFVAFAYLRFPWLQKEFVKVIKRSSDPIINLDKLTDIGVFPQAKSPSKNMVFDWDCGLFCHIKRDPAYVQALEHLEETVESLPKWSQFLFNREDDEFYYGSLLELMNEAELSLSSQGKIMWEYFPYYGEVIGSFLGQMNKSENIQYSKLFKEVSVKVMLNEKLLNIFMLYLFPKTCLFQRSCVMKCLDLIKSCLDSIVLKRNRLPTDFNANYFYSGIVSILEFNHSYLSIRALWILYIYYDVFSNQFQNSLDSYLLGKIFYSLFLHWCGHVRKVFMCLLENKIAKKFCVLDKGEKLLCLQKTEKDEPISEETLQKWKKYKRYINKIFERRTQMQKDEYDKKFKKYHESMKSKLEEKKKRKMVNNNEIELIVPQKPPKKITRKSFLEIDSMENGSYIVTGKSVSDSRNRKWSVACDSPSDAEIPETYVKYLPKAIQEYSIVRSSSDVDGMVNKIMELFQKKKADF